jgi:Na+/H+ antiporter family protein
MTQSAWLGFFATGVVITALIFILKDKKGKAA